MLDYLLNNDACQVVARGLAPRLFAMGSDLGSSELTGRWAT